MSLLRIARNRAGALEITGRAWQEDGKLSARYWSEATREKKEPSGVFYYHKLERPLDPGAPQLDGTGEILLETADRASGYWTTRSDGPVKVNTRTVGVYLRAEPDDLATLDGRRQPEAREADRGSAEALEVDQERLSGKPKGRAAGSVRTLTEARRSLFEVLKHAANPHP